MASHTSSFVSNDDSLSKDEDLSEDYLQKAYDDLYDDSITTNKNIINVSLKLKKKMRN